MTVFFFRSVRRYLTSRGVVFLFGLQMVFLFATFAEPLLPLLRAVTVPVIVEARFVNRFSDFLFAPGYAGPWDPLATLFVLPFVYYATAVVLAALGRTTSRIGHQQFTR